MKRFSLFRTRSDPGVPLHLLRHHAAMFQAVGGIAGSLWKPMPRQVPRNWKVAPIQTLVDAPPESLLKWFMAWCHADPDHYAGAVPPHLFPYWSMPVCARLLAQTGYPLQRIVNQGVRLTVQGALPRGESLLVRASLENIEPLDGRVRFHQRVVTSAAHRPQALVADVVSTLVTGRRGPRRRPTNAASVEMTEITRWDMATGDGLAYGLLSGDLNPLHWSGRYARFMGQKGHIAHGFAQFARSREAMRRAGLSPDDCEVRFVAPLPLPARVILYASAGADEDGWRHMELHSQPGDRLHMVGRFRGA